MPEHSAWRACAYGLTIDSAIPLPSALLPGRRDAEGDVVIQEGLGEPLLEVPATSLGHRFSERRASLACGDGHFISVEEGTRIIVPSGVDVAQFQSALIGPVLGTIVLQRGWLTLHASAVAMDGIALAVCARSGGGKSVTAAALHLRGDPLVTDDVLALPFEDESAVFVVPGYPAVKLWPEGAALLGLNPDTMDLIEPELGKLILYAREGFRVDPLPLGAVLFLEESSQAAASANELAGGEALSSLVEHSYGVSALRQTGHLDRHFEQIADLVRRVPVARVYVPRAMPPNEVADAVHQFGADLVGASIRLS